MRFLAAAVLLAGSLPFSFPRAASLGGQLAYPGEYVPGMVIVARDASGAMVSTQTKRAAFARYPADPLPAPATRAPDFATAPALEKQRTRIHRAASRGPYLAGRAAVARWSCGARCEEWALIDLASGRIDPGAPRARRTFPCAAEPLEFREESRLLRVHQPDGASVKTQDFLWSYAAARLESAGETTLPMEEFCRQQSIR